MTLQHSGSYKVTTATILPIQANFITIFRMRPKVMKERRFIPNNQSIKSKENSK